MVRVVVVSEVGGNSVEDVLLHPALRNTVHALYLVPQTDEQRDNNDDHDDGSSFVLLRRPVKG